MATTREQLLEWLSEPEGTNLEFKEAKQSYHFETLVKYCVALANEGGGKVIRGVTDRRPRRIVGTTAFAEPGHTEAGLHDRLAHRIPIEEMHLAEGRVLVVHVPGRLPGTAWQIDGRYLKRVGDELTAMPDVELRAIFAETGPDFSAELCPGASPADLAPAAIAAFRDRWAKKSRDERKRGLDRETNKALLEQHLREQGEDGSPLSELRQVLPSESGRSIQHLLAELREEGRVALHGQRRWARWVIASPKAKKGL
jgi:ATP-dependent DNA helicase RecG